MRVIDLTQPLDAQTPVYAEPDGYRDPAYVAEPWATIAGQGYGVHRLELGTHTGTHCDAPAHFHAGQRTIDQLPLAALVGRAVVVDVRRSARVTATALDPYAGPVRDGGLPLFLAPDAGVPLSAGAVAAVAAWRPRMILIAGQFVDEGERYYHNRAWLGADIPLVTDLDAEAAVQVRDGDLLVVAPLRLVGLDGSPCRVLAVQGLCPPSVPPAGGGEAILARGGEATPAGGGEATPARGGGSRPRCDAVYNRVQTPPRVEGKHRVSPPWNGGD